MFLFLRSSKFSKTVPYRLSGYDLYTTAASVWCK